MRVLLDQGVARSTVGFLRSLGVEALHVCELGMATASDAAILSAAVERDLVVVTLDADFHALLAISGKAAPSVIRVRAEGLHAQGLADLIVQVLDVAAEELTAGAVISADRTRVRVHMLPITG